MPLIKALIVCMACSAIFCSENKFMGGALFFDDVSMTGDTLSVRIKALLGWKAGFGHCDQSCQLKDKGWGQNFSEETVFSKTFENLGVWSLETTYSGSNTTRKNVTDDVMKYVYSQISLTNDEYGWEQEVGDIHMYFRRDEPPVKSLRFSGSFWTEFDYNFIENLTYVLSEKINTMRRNEHYNFSPLTLFQPLYKIALNQVTTLRLTTVDPDGDFVHCELVMLDNINGPRPLPNIKVNRDCTVEISTMEADGYVDGGVGVVALAMHDYNSRPGNTSYGVAPISSVPIQFMIQTVQSLQDPVFVSPTFEDGHEFIAYEGSTLHVPIYAKPHPGSSKDIDSFNVRSFPDLFGYERGTRLTAQVDKSRTAERVRYAVFPLEVPHFHRATMILGISILYKNGQIGIERHYVLHLKDSFKEFEPKHDKPYFVLSPTDFTCRQNSTCIFTLNSAFNNINSNGFENASVVYTSLRGDINFNNHNTTVIQEEHEYFTTDISITSSSTGVQILCVQVTADLGTTSNPYCVAIHMIPKDIGTTTTSVNMTTGAPSLNCSDVVDVDCQTLDNIAGICALSNNLTRTFCSDYCRVCHNEKHVCSDSQFVDCQSLDQANKICSTRDPVATQYCPRYCKYCTVPSTVPPPSTTTVKPTICTTCTGFECLVSARKVTCPLTTPLCLTVVENVPSGAATYTKSCAAPSSCVVPSSGSSPHDSVCDNFDPMQRYYKDFSCRYCCSSDNCNGGGLTVPRKYVLVRVDQNNIIG